MNWRDRLIARGVFDRLVNIMANSRNRDGSRLEGQIPADHYPTYSASVDFARTLGLPNRAAQDAFRSLMDEARKAVNAGRRFGERPGDPTTPRLNQLPCPENPGGRCTERMEVTGWVEIIDPVSGTRKRVPFVITSDTPMSRTEIVSAAERLALNDVVERGYDAGGRIDPTTAKVGTIIVASITGRG